MAVKITLTDIGGSISNPLGVYYTFDNVTWHWEANVLQTTLLNGYIIDQPGAISYQVRSLSDCYTVLTLACSTTTTTTSPVICNLYFLYNETQEAINVSYTDCFNAPAVITVDGFQTESICAYDVVPITGIFLNNQGPCPTITTTTTRAPILGICYNIIIPVEYLVVDGQDLYITYSPPGQSPVSNSYTLFINISTSPETYFETEVCSVTSPYFERNWSIINVPGATVTTGNYGCTGDSDCPVSTTTSTTFPVTTTTTTVPPTTTTTTTVPSSTTTTTTIPSTTTTTTTIPSTTTTSTTVEGTTTTTTTNEGTTTTTTTNEGTTTTTTTNEGTTTTTTTDSIADQYGFLYNEYAIQNLNNIAASGWKIPSKSDWDALSLYMGNYSQTGAMMKETGTIYWESPNSNATNTYGFNARGSGSRVGDGTFNDHLKGAWWWTSDSATNNSVSISSLLDSISAGHQDSNLGSSIRFIKETTDKTHGQTGTYTGNDGYVYNTICIDNQEWMSENLRETQYRDYSAITEVQDNTSWTNNISGARCYYVI
jgi:uncharacterized protein (TIGR02145 family)